MSPSVVTKSKSTVQFAKPNSKKEEKKRQKELKAIADKQKQIRDHLTREKDFSNKSHQRGWQDWQAWCEEVKFDDLRLELRAVTQSVSYLLDKSSHAVETLQEHRAHAEEQYLRNFQQHVELIDYITEIFKIFQESAHQMYEGERVRLVADFYKDSCLPNALYHQKKIYYENFAHASISLTKCRLHGMREEFDERKVEIESASVVRREEDNNRVMKREAIACSEIRNLVNLFNHKLWPNNRFEQYQEALKKSTHFDKIIKDLSKTTDDYLRKVAKFEDELQNFSREHLVKGAELKSEYSFMTKLMQQAQEKIKTERNWDHEKMKRLATVCNDAKKLLCKRLEKGKSITAAMNICAKHERIDDKFDCFESSDEFQTTVDEKFFKKLAKVEADCVILSSFKAEMLAQNAKLQVAVKESNHEFKLRQNILMLRLDSSPSVGKPVQVSHQISQIKVPIKLRKRWKLCKQCQRDVNYM